MQLLRTSNQDEQFVALTRQLDDELRQRYGELQDLYTPHNRLDCIDTALLGVADAITQMGAATTILGLRKPLLEVLPRLSVLGEAMAAILTTYRRTP